MPENLKDLIEKIQEEGVRAAEDKAAGIEKETQRKADALIKEAKAKASGIIEEAEENSKRTTESGKALLEQAGRDLLLNLKKEINATLENLISARVKETFTPEALAKALTSIIKETKEPRKIVISLAKQDLEKLDSTFLSALKEKVKKGITLKPSEEITAGFTISYDGGKSHFDFTEKAITDYITLYVRPKLAEMLQGAKGGKK